ncbi:MAG: hypothetical protein M0C28_16755 [Candidatus Moduliflexus flocculans]|nr:hypothetical protein [Candidatus Moduliflexus flocculans]
MGLTYSIYSSFAGNKEPGQFDVEVQTKNESAGAVIGDIQTDDENENDVTDQELADAKSYLTGSFQEVETSRKVADFLSVVEILRTRRRLPGALRRLYQCRD